jgi:hypothetical protein
MYSVPQDVPIRTVEGQAAAKEEKVAYTGALVAGLALGAACLGGRGAALYEDSCETHGQ